MKLDCLKKIATETALSIHTLRKFCRQGMPHYRVGRKILIDRAEFDPWFASRFRPDQEADDLDAIVSEALASLDQNTI
jgi:Helix-turn-helix domain